MKIILCLLAVIPLVFSLPQNTSEAAAVPGGITGAPETQATPTAQVIVSEERHVKENFTEAQAINLVHLKSATAAPLNPYGARFYGPGINNLFAIRPHPDAIDVAKQIIVSNPNMSVRVLTNGHVEITDSFGILINVVDELGNNPLEAFGPPEKMSKLQQVRRQLQLEQRLHKERFRLRQQFLQLVLGQANPEENDINF